MQDDYLTPVWADRHGAFSAFFGDLFHQTRNAFERLAARTFDAPWRSGTRPCDIERPDIPYGTDDGAPQRRAG
jgi:hypothetical protein